MISEKVLEKFLSKCWKNGVPMGIDIIINEKYEIDGVKCVADENTYQQLIEYKDSYPHSYQVALHRKTIVLRGLSSLNN